MKNKNQKRIHQTPTIEIRGGRKVKDFRKTKILDSKENLEIDLQTDNTKEKESQSQAGLLKLLERITNLALNLQKEVAELKEDTLVNASHIQIIKNAHSDNLNNLNSNVGNIVSSTSEFVIGLEKELSKNSGNNYTEFLKSLLKEDFNALQKEMLEEGKREILNAKSSAKKAEVEKIYFFLF